MKVRDERVDPCAILIVCCSFFFVCGHISYQGMKRRVLQKPLTCFVDDGPCRGCSTYSIGIDLGLT